MIAAVLITALSAATAAPTQRVEIVVGPTVQWERAVPVRAARELPAPQAKTWSFDQLLPIQTPAIQPGVAAGKLRLAQPLAVPLCVVSADATSVRWLAARANALASAGVSCWVVNVENMAQWARLRDAAANVVLLPMAGDALVELGLRHTPALIQRDGRIEGLGP